jgi:hypothetical protein
MAYSRGREMDDGIWMLPLKPVADGACVFQVERLRNIDDIPFVNRRALVA